MRLLNRKTNIDFFGKRKIAFTLSALLIVISIASLTLRGLNFGLDFTGGALIEVAYSVAPDLEQVRDNLEAAGLDDAASKRSISWRASAESSLNSFRHASSQSAA